MNMCANKVPSVRSVHAYSQKTAYQAAASKNAHIICLSANELSASDADKIVRTWLETEFKGNRAHGKLEKMHKYEKGEI
jgi:ribose 5-phosphate isomerase RpiB